MVQILGNPVQDNMASPVKERLVFLLAILCKLGLISARGGGGRGRGIRVSQGASPAQAHGSSNAITPEIVMYILVIVAFFILFLCFCLFKEPDEKDYFSAHEKEELKKSADEDSDILRDSIDNPV